MTKLNLPTPEGITFMRELNRLLGGTPEACCHDCAFRLGTGPSGCAETVWDAFTCIRTGEPFYCHINEGRACAGWAEAVKEHPPAFKEVVKQLAAQEQSP